MAQWNLFRRDRHKKSSRRFLPSPLDLEERTLLSAVLRSLPAPRA